MKLHGTGRKFIRYIINKVSGKNQIQSPFPDEYFLSLVYFHLSLQQVKQCHQITPYPYSYPRHYKPSLLFSPSSSHPCPVLSKTHTPNSQNIYPLLPFQFFSRVKKSLLLIFQKPRNRSLISIDSFRSISTDYYSLNLSVYVWELIVLR